MKRLVAAMKTPSLREDAPSAEQLQQLVESAQLGKAKEHAVIIGEDAGLNRQLQESFESSKLGVIPNDINPNRIRLAIVEDDKHLGIPLLGSSNEDAIANQVPVLSVKEDDGSLTIYVTRKFWLARGRTAYITDEIWRRYAFAEFVYHEWNEKIEGNPHHAVAQGSYLFRDNLQNLSPIHTIVLEALEQSEEVEDKELLTRLLAEERTPSDEHSRTYEKLFRARLNQVAATAALKRVDLSTLLEVKKMPTFNRPEIAQLVNFLETGDNPPPMASLDGYNRGYNNLYVLDGEQITCHIHKSEPTTKREAVTFEDGSRGVRYWVIEEGTGIMFPFVSYVLYRDGRFLTPKEVRESRRRFDMPKEIPFAVKGFSGPVAMRNYQLIYWIMTGKSRPKDEVVALDSKSCRAFPKLKGRKLNLYLHVALANMNVYEELVELRDENTQVRRAIHYWVVDEDNNPLFLFKEFCFYKDERALDAGEIEDSMRLYGRADSERIPSVSTLERCHFIYFLLTGENPPAMVPVDKFYNGADYLYRLEKKNVKCTIHKSEPTTKREAVTFKDGSRGVRYWVIEEGTGTMYPFVSYVLYRDERFLTPKEVLESRRRYDMPGEIPFAVKGFSGPVAMRNHQLIYWIMTGKSRPKDEVVALDSKGCRAFPKLNGRKLDLYFHVALANMDVYEELVELGGETTGQVRRAIRYWVVDEDNNPLFLFKEFCFYEDERALDAGEIKDSMRLYGRADLEGIPLTSQLNSYHLIYFLLTGNAQTEQVIELDSHCSDHLYLTETAGVRLWVSAHESRVLRVMRSWSEDGSEKRGVEYWALSASGERDNLIVSYTLWDSGRFLDSDEVMETQRILGFPEDSSAPRPRRKWRLELTRFLAHGGTLPARQLVRVGAGGRVYLYTIGDERVTVTVSKTLAGSRVEMESVEFDAEEGVRGVRFWVGETGRRLPIVSYVLFRDGKFIKPQRFPYLGRKRSWVLDILKEVSHNVGPNATYKEILDVLDELTLGVEEWRYALTRLTFGREFSLDEPFDDDGRTLLNIVADERAVDPEALVLAREARPPFEDWLTEHEMRIFIHMLGFEEDFSRLPVEVIYRKIARKYGISLQDIHIVRSKCQVLLSFWNGEGMRMVKEEGVQMTVLRCLPVVFRGLKEDGVRLRMEADALLNRVRLLSGKGWVNKSAIDMAAIHSTEETIRRANSVTSAASGERDLPFAIDATRTIERHPELLLASNMCLATHIEEHYPVLAHQLLDEQIRWEEPIARKGSIPIGGDKYLNIGDRNLEIVKGRQHNRELIIVLDIDTGGVGSLLVVNGQIDEMASQQLISDLEATAKGRDNGPYSLTVRPIEIDRRRAIMPISMRSRTVRFNSPKHMTNVNIAVAPNAFDTVVVHGKRRANCDILFVNRWSTEAGVFSISKTRWLGNSEPEEWTSPALSSLGSASDLNPVHWLAGTPITQWWVEYSYPSTGVSVVGGFKLILGDYNKDRMRIFKDWTGRHIVLYRTDTQATYLFTLTEEGYRHETDGILSPTPGTMVIPLVEMARSEDYPVLTAFFSDVEESLLLAPDNIAFGNGWVLRRNELPFEVIEMVRVCNDIISVTLASNGGELVIKGKPTGFYIGEEWYPRDKPGVVSAEELLVDSPSLQRLVSERFEEHSYYRLVGSLDLEALLVASKWLGEDRDGIETARSEFREALDAKDSLQIALTAHRILNLIAPGYRIRVPNRSGHIWLSGYQIIVGSGTVIFEAEDGKLWLVRLDRYINVETLADAGVTHLIAQYRMKYSQDRKTFITSETPIELPDREHLALSIYDTATERSSDGELLRPQFYNVFVERRTGKDIIYDENKVCIGAQQSINPSGLNILEQRVIGGRIDGVTVAVGNRKIDIRGEEDRIVIERFDESGKLIYHRAHKWPQLRTNYLNALAYKDDAVFWLLYSETPNQFSKGHYNNLPPPSYIADAVGRLIGQHPQFENELLMGVQEHLREVLERGGSLVEAQRRALQVLDVLWPNTMRLNLYDTGAFALNRMDWVFGKFYLSEPAYVIPFVLADGWSIRLWRLANGDICDIPYDPLSNSYWLGGIPEEIKGDDPRRIPVVTDSTSPESRVWLAHKARITDGEGHFLDEALFRLLRRDDFIDKKVGRALRAGLTADDPSAVRSRKRPTYLLFDEDDANRLKCSHSIKVGLSRVGVVFTNSAGNDIEIFIVPEGAVVAGELIKRSHWTSLDPRHPGIIKNCHLRAVMNQSAALWTWLNEYGEGYFNIDGIMVGLEITSIREVQKAALSALFKDGQLTSTGRLIADHGKIEEMIFRKVTTLLSILRDETDDLDFSQHIDMVLHLLEKEATISTPSLVNTALFDGDTVLANPDGFKEQCALLKEIDPHTIAIVTARPETDIEELKRIMERFGLKIGIDAHILSLRGYSLAQYETLLDDKPEGGKTIFELYGDFKVIRGNRIPKDMSSLREAISRV
ncbi:hypothetical protein KKC91_04340 [bacterium]|nr:hypothetical protein [bacterium]